MRSKVMMPSQECAAADGLSTQDFAELSRSLFTARMNLARLESERIRKWKQKMQSGKENVKRLSGILEDAHVDNLLAQIAQEKEKKREITDKIEDLEAKKTILEQRVLQAASSITAAEPPCFCRAIEDYHEGEDTGFLTTRTGDILLATHLEDDHYFGNILTDPDVCGWFPIYITGPAQAEQPEEAWAQNAQHGRRPVSPNVRDCDIHESDIESC